jgi:transposase
MSRNATAKHFRVSVPSAVRWVLRFLELAEISPKPQGDDRRSARVEAHRIYLLGLAWQTPDLTLQAIQKRVTAHCGERFSVSVLWRFFDTHSLALAGDTYLQETPYWEMSRRA